MRMTEATQERLPSNQFDRIGYPKLKSATFPADFSYICRFEWLDCHYILCGGESCGILTHDTLIKSYRSTVPSSNSTVSPKTLSIRQILRS